MPDYAKSKIYKLVNSIDNKIYVGSTCQRLCNRKAIHKQDAGFYPKQKVYKHLNTVGWNNVRIELIEAINCNNKEELRQREQYYRNLLKPELNNNDCYLTIEDKRRKKAQRARKYYSKLQPTYCKDCNKSVKCMHSHKTTKKHLLKSSIEYKYKNMLDNVSRIKQNILNRKNNLR